VVTLLCLRQDCCKGFAAILDLLNHAMLTVVHGEHLDKINLMKLITEFILRNDERRATFKLPI
jgi:hypothetical protein